MPSHSRPSAPPNASDETMMITDHVQLSRRAESAGGNPIGYLMHQALSRPELISLAAGFVCQDTLPVEAMRKANQLVLANDQQARHALQYGTTAGYAPLRQKLLERTVAADGQSLAESPHTLDSVIVTAGSNQLLHLASETLCDPGDIVLCGAPTYFVYLGALEGLGVRSHGVATDDGGIIPEAVELALEQLDAAGELPRVKAIYVPSYYDNPASTTLAIHRREQLVEIARRWSRHGRIFIIEDAAYRELRYYGEDVPSILSFDDRGDTVIHAGTFSKSFAPGVRIGWGILPKPLIEPLLNQKGNLDFGSPNYNQRLMNVVMEEGLLDEHIEKIRAGYRDKLQAMLEAAQEHLAPIADVHWLDVEGGLYVWLKLPGHMEAGVNEPLFNAALDQGVLYVPGEFCYPAEGLPVEKNSIRLSFGVQTPDRIREGVRLLANAVRGLRLEA